MRALAKPQDASSGARLFLMLSVFVPTLAQIGAGIGTSLDRSTAWALLLAFLLAFGVPRRAFPYVLVVLALLLPITSGWIGYSSLNGIGPAVEAVGSVLHSNERELKAAIFAVIARPSFLVPCVLHIVCLYIAWIRWRRHGVGPVARPAVLAGLVFILALQAVQVFSSTGLRVWRSSDISSSLVSSYADWACAAVANDFWRDDWRNDVKTRPSISPETVVTGPRIAIFVIGESTRFDALGAGRAERGPWSKMLQERVQSGLGVWTPAVCSTADFTMYSVPMMMTGSPANRLSDAFSAPSLLNRLRAAGYRTALIRNQADEFSDADYIWDAPYTSRATYDAELLDPTERFLRPLLESAEPTPRAVVIHTAGAHIPYKDRYPPEMFPPESDQLTADAREEVEYDRANEEVARTVAGLGEILDRSASPGVLVYLSDHGENLPSDHNGLRLHMAARISLAGDLVPGLILWNRPYADSHDPLARLTNLLSAKRIAQSDVYHAFLNLADLSKAPIAATPDPLVSGKFEKGGETTIGSCYALKP